MQTRNAFTLASIVIACGLPVGTAHAQTPPNDYVAHEQDATDGANNEGAWPTAPAVGVSNLGVLAAGTRYLSLFSKAATITALDERGVDDLDFPFVPVISSGAVLLDPVANHDPIHNRLWGLYTEAEVVSIDPLAIDDCAFSSSLHLSVNKSGANFGITDPLDDSEWWYYTGSGGSAGNGGEAFDLLDDVSIQKYKGDAAHVPPFYTTRLGSLGFHTITGDPNDRSGGLILATNARTRCFLPEGTNGPTPLNQEVRQFIYVIPYEHDGGASSILDGDRPGESDMTVIRPFEGDVTLGVVADTSTYGCVVQAPFEQVENATFIISVPDTYQPFGSTIPSEAIRLKGVFDADAGVGVDWTLQQRTSSGTLSDNTVDTTLKFYPPREADDFGPITLPRTPDGTWEPEAQGAYFHSAVIAKDGSANGGAFRIFAVHAVLPEDQGNIVQQWVVQWYVLDPNLSNFQSTTPDMWQPTIVAQGRIPVDISEDEGDRYHPVIVVNRRGQAFIEYTYSDETDPMNDDTWPEVRRVRLNNSYTGIVGSETVVRSGPLVAYDDSILETWANVADAQADPVNPCSYWSTHTLVADDSPSPTTKRDAWLFHQAYGTSVGRNCFQTPAMLDLTDDAAVDAYDMAAFTPLYDRRARRVDIDGSGEVDAIDMLLYIDAFDAYTRGR
ncbi:MAG: hypothetical protein RIE32_11145 [Phycisphaerales bacterium]